MGEPISIFHNKRILNMPECEQIRHLEVFFLSHKLKKEIPSWDDFKKMTGGDSVEIVKRAYALALLGKKHLYGEAVPLPRELEAYRPFDAEGKQDTTPTMAELMKWAGSIALFPTIAGKEASCIMMFLFRPETKTPYQDNRSQLCDNKTVSDGHLVYLLRRFVPMKECLSHLNGNSWQLAYALAEKALEDAPERGGNRQKLLNWLVTGALDPQKETTVPVEIGCKPDLLYAYPNVLKLLAPEKNEEDLEQRGIQYQVADSVAQAWRIVTQTGFETGPVHLPDPIRELHVLVGGNIQHLLYVILRLAPEKTVLWHSDKTSEQAEIIVNLFQEIRQDVLGPGKKEFAEFQCRQMDSHNMQACYEDISGAIANSAERKSVVISITGGNRLMGFAALLAARDLGVTVVYRDLDNDENTVTGIKFENRRHYNGDIHGIDRWPGKTVNWEQLCAINRNFPKEVRDIKKAIFS